MVSHIIMDLPAKHDGGLTYLKKPLHIDIAMKKEEREDENETEEKE